MLGANSKPTSGRPGAAEPCWLLLPKGRSKVASKDGGTCCRYGAEQTFAVHTWCGTAHGAGGCEAHVGAHGDAGNAEKGGHLGKLVVDVPIFRDLALLGFRYIPFKYGSRARVSLFNEFSVVLQPATTYCN